MADRRPAKPGECEKAALEVQIVNIDYCMASPTPADCALREPYNIFEESLKQVPVIRIFGTTRSEQRICLHVHKVWPYMYVAYDGARDVEAVRVFGYQLGLSLNHALNVSLKDSSGSLHVAAVVPVKGVPFYGFCAGYHPFLKIFLANPGMLARASSLLASGAVMGRRHEIFESHLSYTMQFLVDYNLYGVDWVRLDKVLYRSPLPEHAANMVHPLTISDDTVPAIYRWVPQGVPSYLVNPTPPDRVCWSELEADAVAADVANRRKVHERLIHHVFNEEKLDTHFGRLIHSLDSIWIDENRRRAQHGLDPLQPKNNQVLPDTPHLPSYQPATQVSASSLRWSNHWRLHSLLQSALADDRRRYQQQLCNNQSDVIANVLGQYNSMDSNGNAMGELGVDVFGVDSAWLSDWPNCREVDIGDIPLIPCGDPGNIRFYAQLSGSPLPVQHADMATDPSGHFEPGVPQNALSVHQGAPLEPATWPAVVDVELINCIEAGTHTSDTGNESTDGLELPRIWYSQPADSASEADDFDDFGASWLEDELPSIDREDGVNASKPMSKIMYSNRPPRRALDLPQLDGATDSVERDITASSRRGRYSTDHRHGAPKHEHFPSEACFTRKHCDVYVDIPHMEGQLLANFVKDRRGGQLSTVASAANATDWGRESDILDVGCSGLGVNLDCSSQHQEGCKIAYTYEPVPPNIDRLVSTLSVYSLVEVVAPVPTFSDDEDMPKRTKVYSGQRIRLSSPALATDSPPQWYGGWWQYSRAPPKVHSSVIGSYLGAKATVVTPIQRQQRDQSDLKWSSVLGTISTYLADTSQSAAATVGAPIPHLPMAPAIPIDAPKRLPIYQSAKVPMSLMSLEALTRCRETAHADPSVDELLSISASFVRYHSQGHTMRAAYRDVVWTCGLSTESTTRMGLSSRIEQQHLADELSMILALVDWTRENDPDILCGYEVQQSSWGYIIERAEVAYNMQLCNRLSRTKGPLRKPQPQRFGREKDSWGHRKGAAITIVGRHVLNIWRLMRSELSLTSYTFEKIVKEVLGEQRPRYAPHQLAAWYSNGPTIARMRALQHVIYRARTALRLLDKTGIVVRAVEFASVIGIDFNSVLTRGSQLRVESLVARIAHPELYILASPTRAQVAQQRAAECLPLVLEPQSRYYTDPVLVLDFQSLYPSIMIAYNYCFSTCLGSLEHINDDIMDSATGTSRRLGFANVHVPAGMLNALKDNVTVSPNGAIFVKPAVRQGLLGRMLSELLESRVMLKDAMKQWGGSDETLFKKLDAWQLGLKLIANVTYGYTGASFSGRMPCVEIADAIVQSGRETLESAIQLIHASHAKWGACVVYGDTDSVFVHLPGKSRQSAFRIGQEIADAVTKMNPAPVKLKFEKMYQPCILLTKKRYTGWMYTTAEQREPLLDVKGMELVRRDGCVATQRILEGTLDSLFRTNDLSLVKSYITTEITRLLRGKLPLQEYTIAKEVRMGAYSGRALPAHARVAADDMQSDPRSEPQHGERVPYIVISGGRNARLVDQVVRPHQLLQRPELRVNSQYYVDKQVVPALDRVLSLIGIDVRAWVNEMPRRLRGSVYDVVLDTHSDSDSETSHGGWTRNQRNVQELELRQSLLGHDGCVNALSWSWDGQLLFSGSDDSTICVWRAAGDGSLLSRFSTGFAERVFDLKLLPAPNDHLLIACSMDASIKVFDVNRILTAASSAKIFANTARPSEDNIVDGSDFCVRTFAVHTAPVKRAAVIPDAPFEFLSCSEDGTARHFDIRERLLPTRLGPEPWQRSGHIVADYHRLHAELHALDVNVFHPSMFAVGGSLTSIMVHDRRMPCSGFDRNKRDPLSINWEGDRCVVRLRRDRLSSKHTIYEKISDSTVTGLRFSRDVPNLVIGSWCYDHAYLFDLNRSPTYTSAIYGERYLLGQVREREAPSDPLSTLPVLKRMRSNETALEPALDAGSNHCVLEWSELYGESHGSGSKYRDDSYLAGQGSSCSICCRAYHDLDSRDSPSRLAHAGRNLAHVSFDAFVADMAEELLIPALGSVSFAIRQLDGEGEGEGAKPRSESLSALKSLDSIEHIDELQGSLLAMSLDVGLDHDRARSLLYNNRACINATIFRQKWIRRFDAYLRYADLRAYDLGTIRHMSVEFMAIKSELESATRDCCIALRLNRYNILAHYNRLLISWDSMRLEVLLRILELSPLVGNSVALQPSSEHDDNEPLLNRLRAEFGELSYRMREVYSHFQSECELVRKEVQLISCFTHIVDRAGKDDRSSVVLGCLVHSNERFFEVSSRLATVLCEDASLVLCMFSQSCEVFADALCSSEANSVDCYALAMHRLSMCWTALGRNSDAIRASPGNLDGQPGVFSIELFASDGQAIVEPHVYLWHRHFPSISDQRLDRRGVSSGFGIYEMPTLPIDSIYRLCPDDELTVNVELAGMAHHRSDLAATGYNVGQTSAIALPVQDTWDIASSPSSRFYHGASSTTSSLHSRQEVGSPMTGFANISSSSSVPDPENQLALPTGNEWPRPTREYLPQHQIVSGGSSPHPSLEGVNQTGGEPELLSNEGCGRTVPVVSPCRRFKGHCNFQTIKDVNFLLDDYVASGSDDGSLFIWSRSTMEVVQIICGDSEVVNAIECHPALPMVAVSGIDSEVRIFSLSQGGPLPAHRNNFPLVKPQHFSESNITDSETKEAYVNAVYARDPYEQALERSGHPALPTNIDIGEIIKHIPRPFPAVSSSRLWERGRVMSQNEDMRLTGLANASLTRSYILGNLLGAGNSSDDDEDSSSGSNIIL
ncbi:DNA polymerase zeta [Coemansia sp. RSA 2050]|nr:DNA polymerase zeta [Coemansia sp. RSA 2050]